LEVNLQGVSGFDVQQRLALSDVQVPIIFLTGYGDLAMTVRALKAGAVNVLTKPCDDEELPDALIAIRTEFPDARVIVLTTYEGDVLILRAVKAGAQG
jgi:FixJ family two-component response regulator